METSEVFAPAVELAEGGFPLSKVGAHFFNAGYLDENENGVWSNAHETYCHAAAADGSVRPYSHGEVLRQPALAESLRRLGRGGAAEFYTGSIGSQLVSFMKEAGGAQRNRELLII